MAVFKFVMLFDLVSISSTLVSFIRGISVDIPVSKSVSIRDVYDLLSEKN